MSGMKTHFSREHRKHIREIVSRETGIQPKRSTFQTVAARTAIAFAAFLVCFLVVTPALAASVPEAYEMLYQVSPQTAQFFKPVQQTSDDQGIEVKVVEAYVNAGSAKVVITVQDKEEKRIDQSVDLYDSYSINTGFDSTATCEQIDYNSDTDTATFLVTVDSMNAQDHIEGEKITFSVSTLLCKKVEDTKYPIALDWEAIPEQSLTESANPYEGSVLVPGTPSTPFLEGFYLTGLGYVDGKLHIQLYTPGRYRYDDHARLYLLDENGVTIEGRAIYRGGYQNGDAQTKRRADFIDYEFDVARENVSNYKLFGDFWRSGQRIDGNWSITFPLENQ